MLKRKVWGMTLGEVVLRGLPATSLATSGASIAERLQMPAAITLGVVLIMGAAGWRAAGRCIESIRDASRT